MKLASAGLFILSFLVALNAHATRKRPFFQASRALAMGDAYTAHDVGFEAVYYNPAGVARPSTPRFKVLDLEFTLSQGAVSVIGEAASSIASMPSVIELVTANVGQTEAVGLSLTPQFITKNMAFGVIARTYAEAYVDPTTALMDFYGTSDLGAYLQFGVSLYGGTVKIGAGVKAIDRAELNRQYTPEEYQGGELSFSTQWKEGVGYGVDAGILLTYPSTMLPALGISVLNLGATALIDRRFIFTGAAGIPGSPNDIPQTVNVGLTLNPKHDRGVKSTFAFEVKDILRITGTEQALDRFHLGWELNIQDFLFFRMGLNEGRYWTAGIGVSNRAMSFELASYGENVSFDPDSYRRDDRKFVGRYAIGF